MKMKSFDVPHKVDNVYDLALPIVITDTTDKRVLFIVDGPDFGEKKNGSLFSGIQGKLLINLVNKAKHTYIVNADDKEFSWSAINFMNADYSKSNYKKQYEYFLKRVLAYIGRFKPTSIVCMSQRFMKYFYPEKFGKLGYENYGKYLGSFVKHEGLKIFLSLDLLDVIQAKGEEGLAGTLGIVSRCIAW